MGTAEIRAEDGGAAQDIAACILTGYPCTRADMMLQILVR
jgi:hypothetical protein